MLSRRLPRSRCAGLRGSVGAPAAGAEVVTRGVLREGDMATEMLAKAFGLTRGILVNVSAADFERPTPCASWDVRSLVNHITEGANWFALCVDAGAAPDPDPTHGVDYAGGDLLASYDQGVVASLAAFGAPGAGPGGRVGFRLPTPT